MRGSPWFRFFTVALTALVLSASLPAHSRASGSSEIPDGTVVQNADTGTGTDSAAGVVGAIVCGGGSWLIRTNPALGMNPYVLAATIAGCLLMLLDCMT